MDNNLCKDRSYGDWQFVVVGIAQGQLTTWQFVAFRAPSEQKHKQTNKIEIMTVL